MIRVATTVGAHLSVDELLAEARRRLEGLVDDVAEWDVVEADLVRVTMNGHVRLPVPRVKGRVVFEKKQKRQRKTASAA